jgi:Carboxypeptidase regulatory-like domain
MRPNILLVAMGLMTLALPTSMLGQSVEVSDLHPATIVGTVTDANNDTVPDATVVLRSPDANDGRRVLANENGFFQFRDVKPGTTYQVSIRANGFEDWRSPVLVLEPGQFKILADIQLRIPTQQTTVQVTYNAEEVATEQVKVEEQQRVLGFIPNFYVVYDPNPEPLTTRLKFNLALKTALDPVTAAGILFLSGIQQAGDTPNYGQGFKGFSKRVGSNTAGGFTNIMIGGAILPSLLHQDPRYFYQGTGTTSSRLRHALYHPFICRGDNRKWQPNYSSIGGDLAASAISMSYYPKSDRGVGVVFTNFAVDTSERIFASIAQEFLLRKLTHKPADSK